jgi:hypothetical protein
MVGRRVSLLGVMLLATMAAKCPGGKTAAKPAKPVAPSAGVTATPAPKLDTTPEKRAAGDSANQVGFGMRGRLSYGGIDKGELRAERAELYDDGLRYVLRGVTVTLTDPLGKVRRTVTAPSGSYDVRRARVDLRGGVTTVSADGRKTTSEHEVIEVAKAKP